MNEPQPVPQWERTHHARVDPHVPGRSLSELILGAQDGIVNVLGVALGVAAAGGGARVVLAAGLAAAFAGAISMAAVAYTSTRAAADVYRSERDREYRHVRTVPTLERAEVREIFERKGFQGELLDRIVDTITADPDVWVAVMMSEEHGLAPTTRRRALQSALVVGFSALVGAMGPVIPFAVATVRVAAWASIAIGAVALFGIGAYKARRTTGNVLRSALEMVTIGLASAFAAWGIGTLFGVSAVGP